MSKEFKFKVGDVVAETGRPKRRDMTVMHSTEDFTACGWHDTERHYQEKVFRTTHLGKDGIHFSM